MTLSLLKIYEFSLHAEPYRSDYRTWLPRHPDPRQLPSPVPRPVSRKFARPPAALLAAAAAWAHGPRADASRHTHPGARRNPSAAQRGSTLPSLNACGSTLDSAVSVVLAGRQLAFLVAPAAVAEHVVAPLRLAAPVVFPSMPSWSLQSSRIFQEVKRLRLAAVENDVVFREAPAAAAA